MATKHKQRQNGQKEKKKPKKTTVAENDQKVQKGPEDSILCTIGRGPK